MAEPLLMRAKEIAQTFSENHLYMYAVVLNSLAELHLKKGQLAKAEAECERSLAFRERIGNPEKIARTLVTFGEIKSKKGDFVAAEIYFRRALELKLRVYGGDHPDLIPVLRRFAHLLSAQHRSQDTADLEERAERIRMRFDLPQYVESTCGDDPTD